MAEWEELQSLVVAWSPGTNGDPWRDILTEIIRSARLECKVLVVCKSQSFVTNAQNYLTTKGVDLSSNVEFVIYPNDSIWMRDYGPTCVYANAVDSMYLIDWIYNRQRPNDNNIPIKLGQYFQAPVFSTALAPYDLVNTGGNFMSDGLGTAFASKLIFRNNDQTPNGDDVEPNDVFGTSNHTEPEIDNILDEFMGIHRYIKMDELTYDGIHHIDMHMKLLDEQTLLVGEYPANTSDGPQIEANIQYVLSQFKTAFGDDFKVVRMPMPPFLNGQYPPFGGTVANKNLYPTYVNLVFVNRTVIMPKYDHPMDAAARDTLQKYLPGYTIAQVNCTEMIDQGGAVHCVTKEIGVKDPLLIVHRPLPCQNNDSTTAYPVFATLRHQSGIAGGKVFYTTDLNLPWQSVDMQYVTGDTAFVWNADIPLQPKGSTVYYYIAAEAQNGKTITRPLTAPQGWWSFCVTESSATTEPPKVEIATIFPNPASGMTVIPLNATQKTATQISLVNTLGERVSTLFDGVIPQGASKQFFRADQFPSGFYFVEIQSNGRIQKQKLIIR